MKPKRKRPDIRGTGFIGACIVLAAVTICVVAACFSRPDGTGGSVRESDTERTALGSAPAFDPDCIDDRLGWIGDPEPLLSGMARFYEATGVQPALCVTNEIDGGMPEDESVIQAFAEAEYDELVGHEQGVLLLFCEWMPEYRDTYYLSGTDALQVMDGNACGILCDYVELYYDSDLTESEYFGAVFRQSADRIMGLDKKLPGEAWIAIDVLATAWFLLGLAWYASRRGRNGA